MGGKAVHGEREEHLHLESTDGEEVGELAQTSEQFQCTPQCSPCCNSRFVNAVPNVWWDTDIVHSTLQSHSCLAPQR